MIATKYQLTSLVQRLRFPLCSKQNNKSKAKRKKELKKEKKKNS